VAITNSGGLATSVLYIVTILLQLSTHLLYKPYTLILTILNGEFNLFYIIATLCDVFIHLRKEVTFSNRFEIFGTLMTTYLASNTSNYEIQI